MLNIALLFLSDDQEFITNIKQTAYYSTNSDREKVPRPTFYSNADESDNRVWLHCIHAEGTRKLIYSPDTDNISYWVDYGTVNATYSCTSAVKQKFYSVS